MVYRAPGDGGELAFRDLSFPDRIGWREVTIRARDGGRVASADVPSTSSSDELRAYPADLLRSPLGVSSAAATVEFGSGPAPAPTIAAVAAPVHVGGGFEKLIERGQLSIGVLLLSFLIAAFWGAAHALTPGHGKAMVAAYLVGTKGTPRDAFLLGGTVTVAHTAGVFALGFVTLGLSAFIVPEQLYPWLTLVSGLLVVLVGASVLRQRLRSRGVGHQHHQHEHGDDHDHHHGHDHHRHHHDEDAALSSKGILGVGVAAGLLPCPSALVVLLSAIALHRVGLGLALIVAFSLGLAATITAIGLVAVLARRTFGRLSLDGPLVRTLPAVSAALILTVGLVITIRARSRRRLAEPIASGGRTRGMFGLDDWIAGLSDGASFGVVLLVAALLGLRHATDPDHIAAMTTLVASGRERVARSAAELGAWWGVGHGITLVVFGIPILLAERYLPERLQQGAETAVAVLIVFLALRLLVRWRHGYFDLHAHPHPERDHRHAVRTPAGALAVGLVHGMGGSAGVGCPSPRGDPVGDRRDRLAPAACALHRGLDDVGHGRLRAHALGAPGRCCIESDDPGARRNQPRVRRLVRRGGVVARAVSVLR